MNKNQLNRMLMTFAAFALNFNLVFVSLAGFAEAQTKPELQSATPQRLDVVVLRPAADGVSAGKRTFPPPTKDEVERFRTGKETKARAVLDFRGLRQMLLNAGVPFEPNVLLEKNWRDHVRNHNGFLEGLSSKQIDGSFKGGTIIADTLILPSELVLTQDTVIFANDIFFEGTEATIRSYGKAIGVFPLNEIAASRLRSRPVAIDPNVMAEDPIKARFLSDFEKFPAGKISISSRGFGYDDWLKSRGVVISGSRADELPYVSPCPNGATGCLPEPTQHGSPGVSGDSYGVSNRGADSPDPVDGSCILAGNPNGQSTGTANPGQAGRNAGNAPQPGQSGGPTPGGNAGAIMCSIPDGSSGQFFFDATGGIGGHGGYGGNGGTGGPGGDAKRGGDGVTCGRTVGNGGNAGTAGRAGDAGAGGNGGNGAKGGNGGNITVDYPAGFGSNVSLIAAKGPGGPAGPRGEAGYPGTPGSGARGGNPGPTVGGVFGNYGNPSNEGGHGDFKSPGTPGSIGSLGDIEGVVNRVERPGGGGENPPPCVSLRENMLQVTCNCTPHYWVYNVSWDGGETWEYQYSVYAGCW